MKKQYALVTGAGKGLGRCFALELARRNINTILVSLPNENLDDTARACKALGADSLYYETDLSVKENIIALAEWVNQNFDLYILINNAGRGGTRRILDCSVDYIYSMIQVNITAAALLTRLLLPNLMRQEKSYILNVSSMASFSPVGYKSVYPASKRFVHHFTRGLYEELKDTNVFVSVVHPGPMKTNEDATKRIMRQGFLGKIGLLSPEKVAKISLRQLFRRDTMILLGFLNQLSWLILVLTPIWIRLPLFTRAVGRELECAR